MGFSIGRSDIPFAVQPGPTQDTAEPEAGSATTVQPAPIQSETAAGAATMVQPGPISAPMAQPGPIQNTATQPGPINAPMSNPGPQQAGAGRQISESFLAGNLLASQLQSQVSGLLAAGGAQQAQRPSAPDASQRELSTQINADQLGMDSSGKLVLNNPDVVAFLRSLVGQNSGSSVTLNFGNTAPTSNPGSQISDAQQIEAIAPPSTRPAQSGLTLPLSRELFEINSEGNITLNNDQLAETLRSMFNQAGGGTLNLQASVNKKE